MVQYCSFKPKLRHSREGGVLVDVHEKLNKTCTYQISMGSNEVPAFAGMTKFWLKRTVLLLREDNEVFLYVKYKLKLDLRRSRKS